MSYTQFGYTTYATASPFVVGPGQSSTPQGSSSSSSASYEPRSCGSPDAPPQTSAVTSPYDAQRLLSSRLAAVSTSLYGGPGGGYPTAAAPVVEQSVAASPYATLEPAQFYPSALNTAYGMKDTGDPWRGISQSAPYYYDPTLAAYGYGGLDFNGARRKNVTRDSTSTLKAWLNEHRKNPYPTKGEKIMLAIITKMTLTQVSTWFANARRRLKKENKMTWEPRNKSESSQSDEGNSRKTSMDDDQDDDDDDDATAGPRDHDGHDSESSSREKRDVFDGRNSTGSNDLLLRNRGLPSIGRDSLVDPRPNDGAFPHHPLHHHHDPCRPRAPCLEHPTTSYITTEGSLPEGAVSSPEMHPGYDREDVMSLSGAEQKPKIWSLADTATNKNPLFQGPAYQNFSAEWNAAETGGMVLGTPAQGYSGGSSFHGFLPPGSTSSYGYGGHSFTAVSLQTDTPPQTPPNMKVSLQQLSISASNTQMNSSSSGSSAFESHQTPLLHLASTSVQNRSCCVSNGNGVQYEEPPVEKKPTCDGFVNNSLVPFQQTTSGSPQCTRDDYSEAQVHYRPPHH